MKRPGDLDLGAVADASEQLEPGARNGIEDPVGPAMEHEPVAVAPHEQHARFRSCRDRTASRSSRNQPPGCREVAGDRYPIG